MYLFDPQTGSVKAELAAPGKPFGITAVGEELRVVISHGEDVDRYLYRATAANGFYLDSRTACPDLTGSYLAFNGSTLYLGQMTLRRPCSTRRRHGRARNCTADAMRAQAVFSGISALPDEARSLAYDGSRWWTCLRDANELASFTCVSCLSA